MNSLNGKVVMHSLYLGLKRVYLFTQSMYMYVCTVHSYMYHKIFLGFFFYNKDYKLHIKIWN